MPQSRPTVVETPETDFEEPNQPIVVLKHPSGSKVFLVGVAHVSSQAQQDVVDTIARVNPSAVVVELDEERYKKLLQSEEYGDKYGLHKLATTSSWKVARMSLTGEILPYGMQLVYVITGAVMGTRPGGEFLAAHSAAEQVGARLVLGDRDQHTTMRRLNYYAHCLARRDSQREAEVRRMRRMMQDRPAEGYSTEGGMRMPGEWPDYMEQDVPPTDREREVAAEVEAAVGPEDPWGVGSMENTVQGSKRRLLEIIKEGGCEKPEDVLQAATRLLHDGLNSQQQISTQDLLTVRACGNKVVEDFRMRAIKGDDTWMQRLELESVSGAKGAAGMERSVAAMKKVVVEERDLILARQLWQAGEDASGQPVVGVLGAGHLKGVQRYWNYAGTPEAEARVQEYLTVPLEAEGGGTITLLGAGAVFATIAYRRPKAAALMVGVATLATAPYVGFVMASMNRFRAMAGKLVAAADRVDDMGEQRDSGWSDSAEGW